MNDRVEAIRGKLFREDGGAIFAVLDGAGTPGLLQQLADHEPEHICLYSGDLEPDMAEVAPYLVKLEPKAQFTDWVVEHGWGNNWGVFAETSENMQSMRKHFRSFLTVYDETGKSLLFRYYDPRVLRVYLPTCNGEELKTMFGPVQSYLLEDENPASMLRFRLKNGALVKQAESVS
jgi:hypothetical protein